LGGGGGLLEFQTKSGEEAWGEVISVRRRFRKEDYLLKGYRELTWFGRKNRRKVNHQGDYVSSINQNEKRGQFA